MCDTNAIGDFDLNLVKIRKPLEFPDATIQSTAYTGGAGVPTLEEVLLSDNDANGEDIIGVGLIQFDDLTTQTTAYTGVPTLANVLGAGNTANNLNISSVSTLTCNQITFSNDLTFQTTAAPISRWLAYSVSTSSSALSNSSLSNNPITIYTTPSLALAGQYQLCGVLKVTTDGSATNLLLREQAQAASGLSTEETQLAQYIDTTAFFAAIGANEFFSTWTMTITTIAPNTVVNVNLRAYWAGGGTVTLSSGCSYQLSYLGYSTGAA